VVLDSIGLLEILLLAVTLEAEVAIAAPPYGVTIGWQR